MTGKRILHLNSVLVFKHHQRRRGTTGGEAYLPIYLRNLSLYREEDVDDRLFYHCASERMSWL